MPEIRSDIAWSTADAIAVRGRSLPDEILGHLGLAEFVHLQLTGEEPDARRARLFEALLVAMVEHGVSPSALAARLTYAGAPEALQGAVAAGLLGFGTVLGGSMDEVARMLYEAKDARETVAAYRAARKPVPGLGHAVHTAEDPRAVRLFAIAAETGFAGDYVALMQAIATEVEAATGRRLPVNTTGAAGALCCELGLPWQIARGIGVMGRALGLVGHILEETERPLALEVWRRAEAEASAHARPDAKP